METRAFLEGSRMTEGVGLTMAEWVAAPAEVQGLMGGLNQEEEGLPESAARWLGRLVAGFDASPEGRDLQRRGWVEDVIELGLDRGDDFRRYRPEHVTEAAYMVATLRVVPEPDGAAIVRELAAFYRYCWRVFGMMTGEACALHLERRDWIERIHSAAEWEEEEPLYADDYDFGPDPEPPADDPRPLAKILPFRRPKPKVRGGR